MSEFTDLEPDVAEIIEADGVAVEITVGSKAYRVQALWEGININGDEQGGPYAWIAEDDMPASWAQGNALVYDGTTYAIAYHEPDGHGITRLVLTDESTL